MLTEMMRGHSAHVYGESLYASHWRRRRRQRRKSLRVISYWLLRIAENRRIDTRLILYYMKLAE